MTDASEDRGDSEESEYLSIEEVPDEAVVLQAGEVLVDGEGVIGRLDPKGPHVETATKRGESR